MMTFTECMTDYLTQDSTIYQTAKGYIAMGGLPLLRKWIESLKPDESNIGTWRVFIRLGDLALDEVDWPTVLNALK